MKENQACDIATQHSKIKEGFEVTNLFKQFNVLV